MNGQSTAGRRRPLVILTTALSLVAVLVPVGEATKAVAASSQAQDAAAPPLTPQLALMQAANTGQPVIVGTETTEASITWANPDGTFTTDIASGPVRVPDPQDATGWTPIDTTLSASSDGVQPAATAADMTFSDGGKDPMASIDIGQRSVELGWPQALPQPTLDGDTATYSDVLPATDLAIQARPDGLETSFIVNKAPTSPLVIEVPLSLTGLKATLDDAGNMVLTRPNGAVVASSDPALMWDSSQDPSTGGSANVVSVDTSVVNEPSGPVLRMTPDASFLADPTTEYPVTIDPTTSLSVTKDTYDESDFPNNNYGGDDQLKLGTPNGGGEKARSFIKFNVNPISGTHVLSSALKLYENYSYSCTASEVDVYRLNSSFDSTTWNSQPTYGAVYAKKSFANGYSSSCPNAWATINDSDIGNSGNTLSNLVQGWANGNITNNGLALRVPDETVSNSWKQFNSSDNANNQPYLSVTYNSYPTKPSSLSPASSSFVNTTRPTLDGTFSDPDKGHGWVDFEIDKNSNGALVVSSCATCSGRQIGNNHDDPWVVPASSLVDGTTYKWKAWNNDGTDVSGNTAFRTFTVDTTPPSGPSNVTSTTHPSQTAWYNYDASHSSFTASWAAATDGNSGLAGYATICDRNSSWTPTGTLQAGTTASCTFSTPGTWYFHVAAEDKAGNWGAVQTYSIHLGGLVTPANSDRSNGTFTLVAQGDPTKVNATVQYRRSPADAWAPIPDGPSGDVTDSGSHVTWPVSLDTSGSTHSLTWNAAATLSGVDGPIELRVQFGTSNPDYTGPIDIALEQNSFGDEANLGPGQANLVTGDFTLGAADVTLWRLGVSRTYDSRNPSTSGIFGPGWSSGSEFSVPYTGLHETASGAVTIYQPGGELDFVQHASGTSIYDPVAETADTGSRFSLTKSSGVFTLTETAGDGSQTTTTFTQPGAGLDYVPSTYSIPGRFGLITTTYAVVGGVARPTETLDRLPIGKGSHYCDGDPSTWAGEPTPPKGCRALTFTYASTTTATGTSSGQWGDVANQLKKVTFYGWDPAASGGSGAVTSADVASYLYDWNGSVGRLRAEWDPRISPALETTYGYDGSNHVTSLTPPGLNPWTINYGTITGDSNTGRVLSVSRPGVPSGTETTTVSYNVPLSGSSAPYSMSASDVSAWAQSPGEAPRYATAIFPPGHVPTTNPPQASDWPWATISYLDNDGRTVNVAQSDGSGGGYITTTEFDQFGNVVRTLSAQDRAIALASTSPSLTATLLDTENVYSVDGTTLTDTFGPQHTIQLASDSSIQLARSHTHYGYSGAPASDPYLATSVTEGARLAGTSSDVEVRTTATTYDASVLSPSVVTVDPSGLSISTKTVYNSNGQVWKSIMPSAYPAGGTAGETDYLYYTGDATSGDSACDNHPEWSGLPCKVEPAAQPSSGPNLRVTTFTYDIWGDIATRTESIASPASTRTTTNHYDAAGRLSTTDISGPGSPVPTVTVHYDDTTGFPTTTSSGGSTITRHYDALGRVDSYTDGDGNLSTFAYDLQDRPTTVSDGKGTDTYSYDDGTERRGLLTTINDSQVGSFTATYNADETLAAQTYPNGMTASMGVDETGQPTSLSYTKTSNCSSDCVWYSDQVVPSIHGQWLSQNSSISSQQYSYDAASRLTQVQDVVGGQCTTRQYGFGGVSGLDSNRTSLTTIAPNTDGSCGSTGPTSNFAYDSADRSTNSGYSFDAMGRITTVPAADNDGTNPLNVTYFANDRVASLQSGSGPTDSVTIDSLNRVRTLTTASGTQTWHYSADGDAPTWIQEGTGASPPWTRNIVGQNGLLVATADQSGLATLQLTNLHGDVVGTASTSQTATSPLTASDQTEFGVQRTPTAQRYGWLGGHEKATDTATIAMLMGARVYLPTVGRFLQPDPLTGGSANAYDYAYQDPVGNSDLSGTFTASVWMTRSELQTFMWGFYALSHYGSGALVIAKVLRSVAGILDLAEWAIATVAGAIIGISAVALVDGIAEAYVQGVIWRTWESFKVYIERWAYAASVALWEWPHRYWFWVTTVWNPRPGFFWGIVYMKSTGWAHFCPTKTYSPCPWFYDS